MDIAWHRGDERAYYLRVHLSEDNVNWTEVLRTVSSAITTGMETYYFDGGSARYVRIIGFTNSATRSMEISGIVFFEALAGSDKLPPAVEEPQADTESGGGGGGSSDWPLLTMLSLLLLIKVRRSLFSSAPNGVFMEAIAPFFIPAKNEA